MAPVSGLQNTWTLCHMLNDFMKKRGKELIADFVNSRLIIILKVVFGDNVDSKIACHSVPTIFFLKKEYIKNRKDIISPLP